MQTPIIIEVDIICVGYSEKRKCCDYLSVVYIL